MLRHSNRLPASRASLRLNQSSALAVAGIAALNIVAQPLNSRSTGSKPSRRSSAITAALALAAAAWRLAVRSRCGV